VNIHNKAICEFEISKLVKRIKNWSFVMLKAYSWWKKSNIVSLPTYLLLKFFIFFRNSIKTSHLLIFNIGTWFYLFHETQIILWFNFQNCDYWAYEELIFEDNYPEQQNVISSLKITLKTTLPLIKPSISIEGCFVSLCFTCANHKTIHIPFTDEKSLYLPTYSVEL